MPAPSSLRIMAWNIAEGSDDRVFGNNATLPGIAEQINNLSPDIVLLNEVVNYNLIAGGGILGLIGGSGGDHVLQAGLIAFLAGYPYVYWGDVNRLGIAGHKAVAVISRYPAAYTALHKIMGGTSETAYGTLEVAIDVNKVRHHVFSTRFDAHVPADNIAAHEQSTNLVKSLDPNAPVIFGGDFNAGVETSQMQNFALNCGLKHACERPDPNICGGHGIDHIFYRGSYYVADMQQRCPWGGEGKMELSDHPWLYTELVPLAEQPPPKPYRTGSFATSDKDEIQYAIKPDVVASDIVEFQLCLGQGLTWEKKMNMPDGSGTSWDLVVNNNKRCDTNGLWAHQVLNGQKFTFYKAKFMGFSWKVHELPISDLGELPGGTLVTFTWIKD